MNKYPTDEPYDIYKAAGMIIIGRKVLAVRARGKDIFIQPGGKLEAGEDELTALAREMSEELGIEIDKESAERLGDFYAEAAGQAGKRLRLAAYIIHKYEGEVKPLSEIEEIMMLGSLIPEGIQVASIFEHDLLPLLVERKLID